MKTKALICDERQQFFLEEVVLPDPGDNHIGIRTVYSGISVGTEFALIRNRISWGPYPLITGYQGAGVIEHIGKNVKGFAPGRWVYYRGRNAPMTLSSGKACSSVSGTHASYALIDTAIFPDSVDLLPPGVDKKAASLFVMPSVGLHGVDLAQPKVGDLAVVIGAGMIGLGAVHALVSRGCRVLVTDIDAKRLEIARLLGAEATSNAREENTQAFVRRHSDQGADLVAECTGIPEQIAPGMELCRRLGKFVYQGNYGSEPYQAQFLPAHGRQLTCYYPCDDGGLPCRRAVLRLMALGALPWEKVITHEVSAQEAPAFFDAINRGKVDGLVGGVIDWSASS